MGSMSDNARWDAHNAINQVPVLCVHKVFHCIKLVKNVSHARADAKHAILTYLQLVFHATQDII